MFLIIILHTSQMEWSQPHVQGDDVTPRAGHAGITIDENWYIVGGGDNSTGKCNLWFYNYVSACLTCFCMHLSSVTLSFRACRLFRDPCSKYVEAGLVYINTCRSKASTC